LVEEPIGTTPEAAAVPAVPSKEEKAVAPKIKTRKRKQRACDEKDEKGKLCAGHLKHWFDYPPEVQALVGKDAEIYRCEFCKTIYRPDPNQQPNSYTVRF
jgi:hypothetical protein